LIRLLHENPEPPGQGSPRFFGICPGKSDDIRRNLSQISRSTVIITNGHIQRHPLRWPDEEAEGSGDGSDALAHPAIKFDTISSYDEKNGSLKGFSPFSLKKSCAEIVVEDRTFRTILLISARGNLGEEERCRKWHPQRTI
jgi:hypothetical protein